MLFNTIDPALESRAERYRRMEEEYDIATQTQKIYGEKTKLLHNWIESMWNRYCEFRGKEPLETMRQASVPVLDNFFRWFLEERRESIHKASSFQTYWNAWTMIRQKRTTLTVEPQLKAAMDGVRQQLTREFGLSTEKKARPIVRAEDEFKLLETLWCSPVMVFEHERYRIQLALLVILAGITGNRPDALLKLTWGDIKFVLLRDPSGRTRARLVVELTFNNTKGYLGAKDPNTIAVPDIPSEPCLVLCPQILFLALAFLDHAFAAPSMKHNPGKLFKMWVSDGTNELALPLDEDLRSKPIFRKVRSSINGPWVSDNEGATYNWFQTQLKKLGEATGFKLPVGPYAFRRGAGEAFDSSSNISETQRNLILQHRDSNVFRKNYASRYITGDTQAAYRGLKPQEDIIRTASGMTRSIDPRRPRSLTHRQLADVKRHPEVKLLLRRRTSLARQLRAEYVTISKSTRTALYDAYQRAHRQHRQKRASVRKAVLAQVKAMYEKQQPITDIERQLNEDRKCEPSAKAAAKVVPLSSERQHAVDALLSFATGSVKEECRRRVAAIEAIVALGTLQQPSIREICVAKRTYTPKVQNPESATDAFPIVCQPTQCICCMGQTELLLERRIKSFHSKGTLKKHFNEVHLRHYPEQTPRECPHPLCRVILNDKSHLRNHAATVHGTFT